MPMEEIENKLNKDSEYNQDITKLNQKIRTYNECKNIRKKFILLQEINHMHMKIKCLLTDLPYAEARHYDGIANFSGVGAALEELGYPFMNGALADNMLTSKGSNKEFGLPERYYWVKKFMNNPEKMQQAAVSKGMLSLMTMKSKLAPQTFPEGHKRYLHALQSFRQELLTKLLELDDETLGSKNKVIRDFSEMLSQVNGEIVTTQDRLKNHLKDKQDVANNVSITNICKELSLLKPQDMGDLTAILRQRTLNQAHKEQIEALLPSLRGFTLTSLGGANQRNWKVSNDEGVALVFQVGSPSQNQALVNQLEHVATNDYLSTTFFSSAFVKDTPFYLVVTDLCSGDLRHERENKFDPNDPEGTLLSAVSTFKELTSICQKLSEQGVAHIDIKLTNFLSNKEGRIVVADKKSIIKTDTQGNLVSPEGTIDTTASYAPPEWQLESKEALNAESFMTYQLGLALYDYLVLPSKESVDKPGHLIVDLDNPIFNSPNGRKLKELIVTMTDPLPSNRPRLAVVTAKLHEYFPQVNFQPEQMDSKVSPPQEQKESNVKSPIRSVFALFQATPKDKLIRKISEELTDKIAMKANHPNPNGTNAQKIAVLREALDVLHDELGHGLRTLDTTIKENPKYSMSRIGIGESTVARYVKEAILIATKQEETKAAEASVTFTH